MMGSDDRSALEELYRATNGPSWNKNTNWCTDSEIESWHGVKTRMCSDGNEHVVELNLPGVYVVIENGCFILLQFCLLYHVLDNDMQGNKLKGSLKVLQDIFVFTDFVLAFAVYYCSLHWCYNRITCAEFS